jgi:hypothetical protein
MDAGSNPAGRAVVQRDAQAYVSNTSTSQDTYKSVYIPTQFSVHTTQKWAFYSNKAKQTRANSINHARYGKMLVIQIFNLSPFSEEFSNEQRTKKH